MSNGLALLGNYRGLLANFPALAAMEGVTVSNGSYFAGCFIIGLVNVLAAVAVMKFVFKPDVTPLKSVARYEKVSVSSIEEAEDVLLDYDNHDIVELEIIQNEPLSASSLKALRKNFACISNVSLVKVSDESLNGTTQKRKLLSDEELFREFYKSMRGFEPSEELVKM